MLSSIFKGRYSVLFSFFAVFIIASFLVRAGLLAVSIHKADFSRCHWWFYHCDAFIADCFTEYDEQVLSEIIRFVFASWIADWIKTAELEDNTMII